MRMLMVQGETGTYYDHYGGSSSAGGREDCAQGWGPCSSWKKEGNCPAKQQQKRSRLAKTLRRSEGGNLKFQKEWN
jgi:hypothetical protein